MKLLFDNAVFRQEPYQIGLIKPMFDEETYTAMVNDFPPFELLKHWGGEAKTDYHKYTLNQNNKAYHDFLTKHPLWWAFYQGIKNKQFPSFIIAMLQSHGVKVETKPDQGWATRFEFAAMPADGGLIAPHTDVTQKAITLVISMMKPGEWDPAWGGGTDVLVPLRPLADTEESYKVPLADFKKVHTYEYEPNQCVLFVKTDNSWHSVGPMTGPVGPLRKTLTLNIERMKLVT